MDSLVVVLYWNSAEIVFHFFFTSQNYENKGTCTSAKWIDKIEIQKCDKIWSFRIVSNRFNYFVEVKKFLWPYSPRGEIGIKSSKSKKFCNFAIIFHHHRLNR